MIRAQRKQRLFNSNSAKEVAAALMQTSRGDHECDMDFDLSWDLYDE